MTADHVLTARDLTLAYGDRTVVESLDLVVPPGRITAIVGANACAKSTMLRALSRLLAPAEGTVVLDGHDLHRLPTKHVARTLGLLPQTPVAPEGIVVGDLVARGRHPTGVCWRGGPPTTRWRSRRRSPRQPRPDSSTGRSTSSLAGNVNASGSR